MRSKIKTALAVLGILVLAAALFGGVMTSKDLEEFLTAVRIGDDLKFYLGAGNDASMEYDADGTGRTLFDAAAGSGFNITTGNLYVGNDTPDQTIDGEDAYVEGVLENDGGIYADGGISLGTAMAVPDDTLVIYGDDNDVSFAYDEATHDRAAMTFASATSGLGIFSGNLFVGDETPDQTIDGEDAYVEGLVEIDGVIYSDGGALVPDDISITFGSDSDVTAQFDEDGNDELQITGNVGIDNDLICREDVNLGGVDHQDTIKLFTRATTRNEADSSDFMDLDFTSEDIGELLRIAAGIDDDGARGQFQAAQFAAQAKVDMNKGSDSLRGSELKATCGTGEGAECDEIMGALSWAVLKGSVAATADAAYGLKAELAGSGGGTYTYTTGAALYGYVSSAGTTTDGAVLKLESTVDEDLPFINFDGAAAADNSKNVSTAQGDGTAECPLKSDGDPAGWEFAKMIKVRLDGDADYWIPIYTYDPN